MKSIHIVILWAVLLAGTVLAQRGPTQEDLNNAHQNTQDWLYIGHDYSQQSFVELGQINTNNAHNLRPVCMYQVGEVGSFQAKPIVYNGIMYFTMLRTTVAIDAANCRERWRHTWEPRADETGLSQRGVTIKDGMVVRGTSDGFLVALDVLTGELVWARQSRSVPDSRENFTNPPLLYEDLLIVGPSWPWPPAKGWVAAFDITTGEEVWSFNTVPDPDEPGAETWGDLEALAAGEFGGVGIWDYSLDPETGLVYIATADPKPDVIFPEGNDNLYTASLLALDARTGELQWYYQLVPGGQYGWDASQAGPLFTTAVNGQERNLIATGGKDGLLHVLDRNTGEKLYAVPITTQKNVGAPFTPQGTHMCPGHRGSLMWNGPAFSPNTNMLYAPVIDWCTTWYAADTGQSEEDLGEDDTILERHFIESDYGESDPIEEARGWLTAVDASTGTIMWRFSSDKPMLGAVTATSGNLVFAGDLNGDFLAFHARNGDVLYRFNTGGSIAGGVVTYELDDKQYVAVMSGHDSRSWGARGAATAVIFALP
jgi:alcohol dehydrogenase (cytochrome c)